MPFVFYNQWVIFDGGSSLYCEGPYLNLKQNSRDYRNKVQKQNET